MGPRRLITILATALLAAPVLPAHAAVDAPTSSFTTQTGAVMVSSSLADGALTGRVEGVSTDDSGIQGVLIRYCNTLFCQYRFDQNPCLPDCAAPQKLAWSFGIPPDGTWQVNVKAVDVAGNMEEPGPEISISVLPLEVPALELPPLPLLDQLPPLPL
jgi:hypothetical protein